MDKIEIERLRAAIQRKYNDRVKEAEIERDRDLEALNRVASLHLDSTGLNKQLNAMDAGSCDEREKVSSAKLREIINTFSGEFSITDVRKIVENEGQVFARPNFHFIVQSMRKNGEIELVNTGTGKRGSTYRKIQIGRTVSGNDDQLAD